MTSKILYAFSYRLRLSINFTSSGIHFRSSSDPLQILFRSSSYTESESYIPSAAPAWDPLQILIRSESPYILASSSNPLQIISQILTRVALPVTRRRVRRSDESLEGHPPASPDPSSHGAGTRSESAWATMAPPEKELRGAYSVTRLWLRATAADWLADSKHATIKDLPRNFFLESEESKISWELQIVPKRNCI
jgi:hypothetical protein